MADKMRDPNAQPDADKLVGFRYASPEAHGESPRYADMIGRDAPVVDTDFRAGTLEEEAYNGGWLRKDRPTGPKPINLLTSSMRGEPGMDNDDLQKSDGIGFQRSLTPTSGGDSGGD